MKKIPTLFKREFIDHQVTKVLNEVTPGCEVVLEGKAVPTVKYDGACCAIIKGELYKRYDAKHGKKPPEGAIPCCDPDPVTGHWPHWVKCSRDKPEDKYFWEGYDTNKAMSEHLTVDIDKVIGDGTYELIGPAVSGDKHNLVDHHELIRHGQDLIYDLVAFSYDAIHQWLRDHNEEGIVFWYNLEPLCKIKRSDFGIPWEGYREES